MYFVFYEFCCLVCSEELTGKSSLYTHMKKNHPTAVIKADCEETDLDPLSPPDKATTSDALLEQAIQSLGVPSDMMLSSSILPEELLENENFSTVNLNDLQ